jgi:hypothetical protein
MVVQHSNYGKFSITVKHTQHTVSVHYSIRDPTFFLQLIKFSTRYKYRRYQSRFFVMNIELYNNILFHLFRNIFIIE